MRKIAATLLIALLPIATLTAGDALRAVTHEDVWVTKRLGTPVVSPDGRFAVVAVTEPSYEEDETASDLWLIDVAGGAGPRRLTASNAAEGGVDWSPDSSRIAFHTKRGKDEENQVYVLNMDGPGEAIRLTNLATGAKNPKWSPDGKRIAFESRVYPGAADEEANAAEKRRAKNASTTSRLTRYSRSVSGTAGAMICRRTCSCRTPRPAQRRPTCSSAASWSPMPDSAVPNPFPRIRWPRSGRPTAPQS